MEWEFGRGSAAQHVLVVCCAGDRSLRATAERWRRAAPPADELFEFAAGEVPAAAIRPIVAGWGEGRPSVTATYDPGWKRVAHLRP